MNSLIIINGSNKMKVLFLDIDGVCNCATTSQRHRGFIGIDPYMAFMIGQITLEVPDLKVVLSSSWRHSKDGLDEVRSQVVDFIDITPTGMYIDGEQTLRGREIQEWLNKHPDVEKYAILDDDSDILSEQLPNFFKTSWQTGITEEIKQNVIKHFKKEN